ncbi:PTS sugar transporter subunit IIA [Gracilibacillus dipsosauri]|uniref:PTS glucose transporter subunit IIA n=1 Tax=Gracilibacillus dipsosauri TaxID=178340 RepID=A0A317KVZ0_9BACI|nr:PTS glucose transporter subunit IIA [Gracilibacillus dipsosauri]PWU66598.1 PTS glucose transporter subunit IIA [Gracilibacillus dipsosauri]
MFNKLFGKKKITEEWVTPLSGKLIAIEEVPDPTFSKKLMGDGVAIVPSEGKVVSPVDGEIIQLFPTKHAIGIKSENGIEILIHIGLETVSLNGEPFETYIKTNDKVKAGQLLVSFNLEQINVEAASIITPIVITNEDKIDNLSKQDSREVSAGKTAIVSYEVKK